MFYAHNNQLPRVNTAQVESVYGLIKAEGRMDLLCEYLGSLCYTLRNPYRYIWHPAEKELTRKWAAADRNRSAPWPTTCYFCMVPRAKWVPSWRKDPTPPTPTLGTTRHPRGWMSKDLPGARQLREARDMNNISRLFSPSMARSLTFSGKKRNAFHCCCFCRCWGSTKGDEEVSFFFIF